MTELLSPAGNFDKLKTAVRYGASAVYLAGYKYSLRSGSDNFSENELQKAVDYAHLNQCKVYCTLNAFLHDTDFADFNRYIRYLEQIGIDAVIVSDIGVAGIISSESHLRIHVSTQASVLNTYHAELWKKMGAKRVVLGREVSVREAAAIKKNTGLEIEVFVHGAMCMSYSGHCTISNYTAGRDSNRGGCIQSCRHSYTNHRNQFQSSDYLMSSKDLNSLAHLPDLYNMGIDSLKIEGRMKSMLYVATVTNTYANALKQLKQNKTQDFSELNDELTKLPYRNYCDGSNATDAGWDSVYRDHNPLKDAYRMAGYVIETKDDLHVIFYATSKIHQGQNIEFIDTAETNHFVLDHFTDILGNSAQIMLPNHLYVIPLAVSPNTVARVKDDSIHQKAEAPDIFADASAL